MVLYLEIDQGAGFSYAGIIQSDLTKQQVGESAKDLRIDYPDWDNNGPQPQPPAKETVEKSGGLPNKLTKFLDEGDILELSVGSEALQRIARNARDLRWSGTRVRVLI
jgi:hypothetical protein